MPQAVGSLDVFRRAYALSLEIHRASLVFPKLEQYGGIADQLRRASKSVCALLAEGSGRQSGSEAEFRRYVVMALGSAEECKLWCRYAADLGCVDAATAASWQAAYGEIARMLQGLRKHLSTLTSGDLASVLEMLPVENRERVGICWDTCHLFAAGIDFTEEYKYERMVESFDRIVGLDKLRAIHMNDSKKGLGSHVDRHDHIGKGLLGLEPFRYIMNDPRLSHIPKILETPKGDAGEEKACDMMNLKALTDLIETPEESKVPAKSI